MATKSLLPKPLLTLAGDAGLRDAFCELTTTRPETLEQVIHLWAAGTAWNVVRIPKPKGGERVIMAPSDPLKELSRNILHHVVQRLPVHRAVHGAHANTSVVTNARRHAGFARAVYNIDLKDAFPSTTLSRVRKVLRPTLIMNVIMPSIDVDASTAEELAEIVLAFCLVENQLPQGFPTSPGLLNAVLFPVDGEINRFLRGKEGEWRLTRYVDDITVSTSADTIDSWMRKQILKIIRSHGWNINRGKIHYFGAAPEGDAERSTKMPVVTGLVIHPDGRVTIPRWKLERWRAFLHGICAAEIVSDLDRARAAGIVGYVGMVYDGELPSAIRKPYALAKARFGGAARLREISSGEVDPTVAPEQGDDEEGEE